MPAWPITNRDTAPFAAFAAFAALLLGVMAQVRPSLAVGMVGGALLTLLAFRYPVAHLTALIGVTAIVPLDLLNTFSAGGGANGAGVSPADALLFTGLLRATVVLPRRPIEGHRWVLVALVAAFLAGATLQFAHGITAGVPVADAAAEMRVLLGFGTLLIALPIVDDPAARRRLLMALLGVAVVLGLWGILQWALQLQFGSAADIAIRKGSRFQTAGRTVGQYGFPVATIITLAVLASGQIRDLRVRVLLMVALVLNGIAMILTFERTFWVATVVGIGVVVLRGDPRQRVRILVGAPAAFILLVVVVSLAAPAALTAAGQRLLTFQKLSSDRSVGYRVQENDRVMRKIHARPLTGSGLGATMIIGRPGTTVQPKPRRYAENGYLWLVWKLGLPGAALLLAAILFAALWPPGRSADPRQRPLQIGCQAALLALLVASVAFPSFNAIGITPTTGLLMALATAPALLPAGAPARAASGRPARQPRSRPSPRPVVI